jgi:hypothetical protein
MTHNRHYEVKSVRNQRSKNRHYYFARKVSPLPGLMKDPWLPISREQFDRMLRDGAIDVTPKEV